MTTRVLPAVATIGMLGLSVAWPLPSIAAPNAAAQDAPTAAKRGQPTATARARANRRRRKGQAPPAGEVAPVDSAAAPRTKNPPVVRLPGGKGKPIRGQGIRPAPTLGGWSRDLAEPRFVDPRRRLVRGAPPADFADTLKPGEHFRFDVTFAGNPAGLAEASVIAIEPDLRGPSPAGAARIRLEGHARTSGVVSLLASVTDDIVTYMDADTGAAISSVNVLHYSGWAPRKYKHRVTEHAYEGRGQVRITDTKDDKIRKKLMKVPADTFDPMAAMAWVRSLRLDKGDTATAHVIDGTTLMRIEIESAGRTRMGDMPSIGIAMGLSRDDARLIDGRITRVDRHDQPIPDKRVFKLRAWLSDDERRVPLVMESDMWVGAIRLELSAYDPPEARRQPRGPATRAQPKPATAPPAAPPR